MKLSNIYRVYRYNYFITSFYCLISTFQYSTATSAVIKSRNCTADVDSVSFKNNSFVSNYLVDC